MSLRLAYLAALSPFIWLACWPVRGAKDADILILRDQAAMLQSQAEALEAIPG